MIGIDWTKPTLKDRIEKLLADGGARLVNYTRENRQSIRFLFNTPPHHGWVMKVEVLEDGDSDEPLYKQARLQIAQWFFGA